MYYPFRFAMLGVFGFIALSQALQLISPFLQGKVIDGLVSKQSFGHTMMYVWAILGVAFVRIVVLAYIRDIYELKFIDFTVMRHVSQKTLERLLMFSIGQHVSENSGIKQSVINRGQHSLTALAHAVLYQVVPMCIEVVLLIGALLYWSPVLGCIALSGAVIYVVVVTFINNHFRDDLKESEKRYVESSRFHGEMLRNVDIVLANAQEARAVRECDEHLDRAIQFTRNMWMRFALFVTGRSTVVSLTRFGVMAAGVWLAVHGRHTVGELVMLWVWSNDALNQVSGVGSLHRQLMQMYASVKKYFDMLDIEPDVKEIENPIKPASFGGRIIFDNVTFRYRPREASDSDQKVEASGETGPALDGVSFVIEPGQRVAFVGESGAGKSTIVNALLRAQDPVDGTIFVDGHDLRHLDLGTYRSAVGVVDQSVTLFDQSLRYNMTFGLSGRAREVSDRELRRIAEMACVDRFLHRLEKGFDTEIGERGVKLSGGERQRVGIARALIKDPDILIFDEATSNLDPANEASIAEAIKRASEGRTTIIIAHRFSTIRGVDKVFVFDKGALVGEGRHEDLMVSCEAYQRLVRSQLA